jgi:hypothetical protein
MCARTTSKVLLGLLLGASLPAAEPPVEVRVLDPHMDASRLDKRTYHGGAVESPDGEILPARKRDELLRQAGFAESELARLDQLDRDLLVLRAKKASFARLREAYPKLDEGKLAELRRLVR